MNVMALNGGNLKKTIYTDAHTFSEDTFKFLAGTMDLEMENNLALGLIERIKSGIYQDPYLFVAKDDDGNPNLAALLTPPYNLILTRGDKRALSILIEDLAERRQLVPGVVGPDDMVEAFMAEWTKNSSEYVQTGLKMTFYTITDVNMPERIPGKLRLAENGDTPWLAEWMSRFGIDSNLSAAEQKIDLENTSKKVRGGLVYIWENNNVPVSIASYAPLTENGVRIGSVYTPLDMRGKGYASACVATLSQAMLDGGRKWCSLFANMANPISNGIYKKIGYREHCIYQERRFET